MFQRETACCLRRSGNNSSGQDGLQMLIKQTLIAPTMIGAFELRVDISALIVCMLVQSILLMCVVHKSLIQIQVDSCSVNLAPIVRLNCESYPTGTNSTNFKAEEAVLAMRCKIEYVYAYL